MRLRDRAPQPLRYKRLRPNLNLIGIDDGRRVITHAAMPGGAWTAQAQPRQMTGKIAHQVLETPALHPVEAGEVGRREMLLHHQHQTRSKQELMSRHAERTDGSRPGSMEAAGTQRDEVARDLPQVIPAREQNQGGAFRVAEMVNKVKRLPFGDNVIKAISGVTPAPTARPG